MVNIRIFFVPVLLLVAASSSIVFIEVIIFLVIILIVVTGFISEVVCSIFEVFIGIQVVETHVLVAAAVVVAAMKLAAIVTAVLMIVVVVGIEAGILELAVELSRPLFASFEMLAIRILGERAKQAVMTLQAAVEAIDGPGVEFQHILYFLARIGQFERILQSSLSLLIEQLRVAFVRAIINPAAAAKAFLLQKFARGRGKRRGGGDIKLSFASSVSSSISLHFVLEEYKLIWLPSFLTLASGKG